MQGGKGNKNIPWTASVVLEVAAEAAVAAQASFRPQRAAGPIDGEVSRTWDFLGGNQCRRLSVSSDFHYLLAYIIEIVAMKIV